MAYLQLGIAIIAEVIGTSFLKASEGFTKPIPTLIMLVGYLVAFYALSLTLKTLPVGVVYATWSGVGIALITLIGYFVFSQTLDWVAILGISLIILGVLILNLFSKSIAH